MRGAAEAVSTACVQVWRGTVEESRHAVDVAVVDADGGLVAFAGDPELVTFARSAIKPLQALPVIEDGAADRYGFTPAELALCCASHSGEPHHVAIVREMLRKIGLGEDALACGPHLPFYAPAAEALLRAGAQPGRVHNNCSGKHAGMLALACVHGWTTAGYHLAEHPVQRRIAQEVARWTNVPVSAMPTAVDGCGVVTFALSLTAMAAAFARLSDAARRDEPAPARVVRAMAAYPENVGGTGRLCTDLMRATRGGVLAKVGAEGVYCAGIPAMGLGVALKVEDGATRASQPALIEVLRQIGALQSDAIAELDTYAYPTVMNTRGETVGALLTELTLERTHE
jgi:L-asparaginase II